MKRLLLLVALVGCGDSGELTAMRAAFENAKETVVSEQKATAEKTTEAVVILKENTAALARIESKLEASLASPKPQQSGGDPASALESPPAKNAKDSHPTKGIVAEPVGTRLASDGTRLRWNVEGNWNPTILETSAHLAEHGIDTNGMTHQQMADIHADIHEGKTSGGAPLTGSIFQNNRAGAITSQRTTFRSVPQRVSFFGRTKYSNRQSCPSGRCPQR